MGNNNGDFYFNRFMDNIDRGLFIKMVEFNLSQKIGKDEKIYMGDVKNFIKILKEEFDFVGHQEFIDKHAGEFLI